MSHYRRVRPNIMREFNTNFAEKYICRSAFIYVFRLRISFVYNNSNGEQWKLLESNWIGLTELGTGRKNKAIYIESCTLSFYAMFTFCTAKFIGYAVFEAKDRNRHRILSSIAGDLPDDLKKY